MTHMEHDTTYNHSLNHRDAAEAHGIAAARRDAFAAGTLTTVRFAWTADNVKTATGTRYDMEWLARDLRANGCPHVEIV